jgi:hypothetical protein
VSIARASIAAATDLAMLEPQDRTAFRQKAPEAVHWPRAPSVVLVDVAPGRLDHRGAVWARPGVRPYDRKRIPGLGGVALPEVAYALVELASKAMADPVSTRSISASRRFWLIPAIS